MTPSHDALSAVPGDKITFFNEYGDLDTQTVKLSFWQTSPKGGKVWSYELHDGSVIPNERVQAVIKPETKQELPMFNVWEDADNIELIRVLLEDTKLSSTMKTAISCILDGDDKGLEIAQFLITVHRNKAFSKQTDRA